jgi:hypothetical protein
MTARVSPLSPVVLLSLSPTLDIRVSVFIFTADCGFDPERAGTPDSFHADSLVLVPVHLAFSASALIAYPGLGFGN